MPIFDSQQEELEKDFLLTAGHLSESLNLLSSHPLTHLLSWMLELLNERYRAAQMLRRDRL